MDRAGNVTPDPHHNLGDEELLRDEDIRRRVRHFFQEADRGKQAKSALAWIASLALVDTVLVSSRHDVLCELVHALLCEAGAKWGRLQRMSAS